MEIISLYDFSGEALKPWAHAGYACYAYDIEHPPSGRMSEGIHYEHADLHDEATVQKIIAIMLSSCLILLVAVQIRMMRRVC